MSRTKKGKKGPGYEYWSKRPSNLKGLTGNEAKKDTAKAERRKDKKLVKEELKKIDGE